ncbi:hypothetical protein BKA66DRAFT_472329 [Pyrenochaeta sp. MPI-SDFR-AT-0127]|nr:hypothetical protein BKA66DRAFT_472329 [Pyrenochaeta sp. MPI-SDFR-AT-0127]
MFNRYLYLYFPETQKVFRAPPRLPPTSSHPNQVSTPSRFAQAIPISHQGQQCASQCWVS